MRNFVSSKFPVPGPSAADGSLDILSAYDDLIENNRRRIALLEEAARMLYREWFVRFRFPGHEHVKIIDGLPEGWERRTFGELRGDWRRHTFDREARVLERRRYALVHADRHHAQLAALRYWISATKITEAERRGSERRQMLPAGHRT